MSARHVTITLTLAQAKGLSALAGSGEECMTDPSWARGYIGNISRQQAARHGVRALERAIRLEMHRVDMAGRRKAALKVLRERKGAATRGAP